MILKNYKKLLKILFSNLYNMGKNNIENFKKNNFDLAVVVAYGKILPLELINTPKYGMVNVHYSLLPKYRGATPVESAILAGDKETGVSIQQMIFNLDAGDIIDEERTNINENEGTQELRSRLNEMAKILLPKTIQKIVEGSATFKKQNNLDATYSKKIKKEDARIDFEDDPYKNFLKIRAYNVWPVAFFFKEHLGKKIRVKITDVSFSDGKLIIKKVIPEGKKEMDYESFVRGYN